MVAVIGEAGVALRPETGRFAREAEDAVDKDMPGVGKKAAGYFVAAFAAIGIGKFLGDAVSEASDLSESASKVGVVFGGAAQSVRDFASNASSSLGITESAALEATGTFGNLLRSTGLAEDASADMSTSMVQLAGDLASFNNASPEEALDALRAGLLGEADPLKRFGVNLNQAAVEAKAAELGLVGVNGELSDAQKAQAAYAVIMEQTSLAQGDFLRTSAGLANQQRIVKAQFGDLSADIGGLFVPVLGNASGLITGRLMPALLDLTSGLPDLGNALGTVGDMFRLGFSDGNLAVNDATAGLEGLPFQIGQVSGAAGDLAAIFHEAFVDGAAGGALLAEDSLQGMAARAGVNFSFLRGVFLDTWAQLGAGLTPVLSAVMDALSGAFSTIGATISGAFSGGGSGGGLAGFLTGLQTVVQAVIPLVIDYFTRWAGVIQAVIPAIVAIVQSLVPVLVELFGMIGPVLQALLPVISQVAGVLASTLVAVITALVPVLPVLVSAIGAVATALAGGLLAVIQALAPVLPVLVSAIADIASALAGALAGALAAIAPILPQLATALAQVAAALAGALGGALRAILPVLPVLIDAIIELVMGALTPLLPLLPIIANLFSTIIGAVAPFIPVLVQVIAQIIQLALRALTPLLPMIPMLANFFVGLITNLAPFLPLIGRVITMILDLATQALIPLMPVIEMLIGAFVGIVNFMMPILSVGLQVVGFFSGLFANIVAAAVGFAVTIGEKISEVVGFFLGLPARLLSALGNLGGLLVGVGGDIIHGLINGISTAAGYVGNIAKNIVNGLIGFINSAIDGLNDLFEFTIPIPGLPDIHVNPPDIGHIPRFHSGGVFATGGGEGLALLRNDERIATPEQRVVADALLADLLDGTLSAPAAAPAGGDPIQIHEHIHQAPGEPVGSLAARVTQNVVWRLNGGITRSVGRESVTA